MLKIVEMLSFAVFWKHYLPTFSPGDRAGKSVAESAEEPVILESTKYFSLFVNIDR